MRALEYIKNKLQLKKNRQITLLLSGGESVKLIYRQLFKLIKKNINIQIFLTDERITSNKSHSNEKKIKEILIKSHLCKYNFLSLSSELKKRKKKFNLVKNYNRKIIDFAFLGMGSDGHIASLFPAMDNYRIATSSRARKSLLVTKKIGIPFCKRITVNLSLILSAREIFIIIKSKTRYNLLKFILKNKLLNCPIYKLLNYGEKKIKVIYKGNFLRFREYLK